MKLMKFNPFREIENMFDRFAKAISSSKESSDNNVMTGGWAPPANLMEYDKEFIVEIEVPGVNKEDVKVMLDKGILSVVGKRWIDKQAKNKKTHSVEKIFSQFTRAFKMPENIDEKNISAAFKDSILKVSIPKQKNETPNDMKLKIL